MENQYLRNEVPSLYNNIYNIIQFKTFSLPTKNNITRRKFSNNPRKLKTSKL